MKRKVNATCTMVYTCHDQVELEVEYDDSKEDSLDAITRAVYAYDGEPTEGLTLEDWEIDELEEDDE